MKKILSIFLILSLFNLFYPAHCMPNKKVNVKSGTNILLLIPIIKTSKSTTSGEQITLEIYKDVTINNITVFKKGDKAFLNVAEAKKAGFIGRPGILQILNGTVNDANGESRKIRFYQTITGEEKTYPKVMLGISIFFLWPLALAGFVKGGEAKFYSIEPITVFTDENFTFIPE